MLINVKHQFHPHSFQGENHHIVRQVFSPRHRRRFKYGAHEFERAAF